MRWTCLAAALVMTLSTSTTTWPAAELASDERAFLEELSRRSFLFFWEQADPATGLIADRARADGSNRPQVASIAAVGFGLTGLCIAAERGWVERDAAYERVLKTLRYLWHEMPHERGFFYHFVDRSTGERVWDCELSSIDTALLLAGALTARQYFPDTEVAELARKLYERVEWDWMMAGTDLMNMGWTPEGGFLHAEWDNYSEHLILYLMAIGSPTHPIEPRIWHTWARRPEITYARKHFLACPPLFTHQYSQAWVDFRGRRDDYADYWMNSVLATRAQRRMSILMQDRFPKWGPKLWGVTASDAADHYRAWGGPPATDDLDGTVVPCAAAGSIPFAPDITIPTLRHMYEAYGDEIWTHYGFVDAFNPHTGWVNDDVIGIDVGITLVQIENHRSGFVWEHFMANAAIRRAMELAGFREIEMNEDGSYPVRHNRDGHETSIYRTWTEQDRRRSSHE